VTRADRAKREVKMRATRGLNRRSFLFSVTGLAAGGSLLAPAAARALQPADQDSGPTADGTGPRGRTDCDTGPSADPIGRGTGHGRQTGVTDTDSGATADPENCGRRGTGKPPGPYDSDPTDRAGDRRRSGVTDRDPRDPPGYGNREPRRHIRGCTDSDTGRYRDPARNGLGTGLNDRDPGDPAMCGRPPRPSGGQR
jgi:hypothetical protein